MLTGRRQVLCWILSLAACGCQKLNLRSQNPDDDDVKPPETQSWVRHIEPRHLPGQCTHLDIPIHQRPAILGINGGPQRRAVSSLHARALRIESRIQRRHVLALGFQFVFVVPS